MKLFVGNVTAQIHQFLYRVPEQVKILRQDIPPGRQIQIAGDLSREAVDHVIEQHAPYGMIPVEEIPRTAKFHGLCYSIDRTIPTDKLNYLRDHNHGELVEEGRALRRAAAIAGNDVLERTLIENDRNEQVQQFELSVQEDREIESDLPQLSESLRVVRNSNPAPAPSRRSRRKVA